MIHSKKLHDEIIAILEDNSNDMAIEETDESTKVIFEEDYEKLCFKILDLFAEKKQEN